MNSEETWVIQTAELVIGSTLSFDLNDATGVVLHKAGMPISQRLIDRLQKKCIHSVTVKGRAREVPSLTAMLLSYYDSATIEAVERILTGSEQALNRFAASIREGKGSDIAELRENIDQFIDTARTESSAAFAVIASRLKSISPDIASRLSFRSTLLALTGVTVGCLTDCSDDECVEIGMVGLLHDCSLLLHPEWFGEGGWLHSKDAALTEFRNHPIESAELLNGVPGINEQVLEAIAQVHEQFDGSGYPHSLWGSQIRSSANIINAVDAYLNLVDPLFHKNRILPADALAFLCHNAANGRFSAQVIRGLIMGMSIYPIGSMVELDDESLALVVCSNPGNPIEPIVRLMTEGNDLADLSSSPRTIVGPSTRIDQSIQRMSKSRMDEMLWRCDIQNEPAFA